MVRVGIEIMNYGVRFTKYEKYEWLLNGQKEQKNLESFIETNMFKVTINLVQRALKS